MLKRVSIQNFKSLKDVTLDLQKVNLLIGPNNSGKTNFLKALETIHTHEKTLLENKRAVFREASEKHFSVKVILYNYGYTFDSQKIIDEVFDINTSRPNSTKDHYFIVPLEERRNDPFGDFDTNKSQKIGFFTIYKPNPELITKTALLTEVTTIDATCAQIVPYIFNLSQNNKKLFKKLETDLERCVGDLVSVSTPAVSTSEGSQLRLKFFDKQSNDFWADEVSEGVLYFFAILCIINQPNPPKLLLLEEPEKGIHPRRIFEIIQFIFRLAEEKDVQVIMTTHSPIVVDLFKDMPESVFIFDKDDEGATHVKNLQRDIIEPETERSRDLGIESPHYLDSLGDAWTVGFLGGVPK